ncbi:hypothetical protein [Cesiribacter andamanensis]|uniref:hypothetical protein n=1 Tax=Cesiribacter andamanensis TaxID=649507 RepID=UPI00034A7E67|nr:hypothetical protein [Cesiribacter andamanensis]
MKKFTLFLSFSLLLAGQLLAQGRRNEDKILTFETIYDAPYEINKLWIGFQPLYTELFVTNVNLGYGLEASYFWKDKANFRAHLRKPYASYLDQQRHVAKLNSTEIENSIAVYHFAELGGTYHIKDWEHDTESLIYLYSKRYAGNKWASMVPEKSKVQTKVRKIIGARAGGYSYQTAVGLDRMYSQEKLSLLDAEGTALPQGLYPFTNAYVKGGYLGGSFSWIKNFAIDPDRTYDDLVKDLMLTVYGDILFAGNIRYDDIFYRPDKAQPAVAYSIADLGKNYFGFRAGIEGRFNRTLSWAYNGELGYRPGVKGQGLYALIKISFPVYSTDLNNNVEAFSK